MTIQQHASFDSSAAELNATSKLVKAWESKNAKNAAKAGGISLMALSLAACGGSDDAAAIVDGGTAGDGTTTDDGATTPVALTALQSAVAAIVVSNVTGADSVEAATLALATNAAATSVTATTTAPTTVAGVEEMLGDAAAIVFAAADDLQSAGNTNISDLYETLVSATAALDNTAPAAAGGDVNGQANFDLMVDALSATTAAGKTAVATNTAAADALLSSLATTTSLAVTTATQALGTLDATDTADLAAFNGVAASLGSNVANAMLVRDTVAATNAEFSLGEQAFAASLVSAVVAMTGITTTAAESSAAVAALLGTGLGETTANGGTNQTVYLSTDGVGANTAGGAAAQTAGGIVVDANTGAVLGAIEGIANTDTGTAGDYINSGETAIMLTALLDLAGDALDAGGTTYATALDAIAGGGTLGTDAAVEAVMAATYTNTITSAVVEQYDAIVAAFADVVDASTSVDALDVQATIIELQNDGTTITMATGATAAASANDDMFGYVTDLDNSVTIGSATQAFGANGDDTLIIAGEYTFTTITKAQADAIATETLGDASALEIFVYQDATSGDAVLHVERSAGEGNVEGTTMSTITLTDVTFADLGQTVADDVTVLTSAAVIA